MSADQEQIEVEWPTDCSSYSLLVQIGKGAFATVWKASTTNTTTTSVVGREEEGEESSPSSLSVDCAVKILNLDHIDTNLAEIRLEVQAMRLSSHPNILTMYTAFVADTHLWLVTPLMQKGSSLHCLQTARRILSSRSSRGSNTSTGGGGGGGVGPVMMQDHILYILHETVLGLQYIHNNGQIHRDMKGGNILLDNDGRVQIADFGVSGWLVQGGQQSNKAQTFVGTPCWMAPEVMEQVHGYDTSADIWSLGITALELAKGYAPYAKYPPMKVLILTIQEDPPSLESYMDDSNVNDEDEVTEEFSKAFIQLVDACLQKNPSRRPNCQELLKKHLQMDESQRQERRARIVEEVCSLVPDVGSSMTGGRSSSFQQQQQPASVPGDTPISIILSTGEKDRPPGTTWVFADGSSTAQEELVMEHNSSTLTTSNKEQVAAMATGAVDDDDVLAELDEFGKQTGGEHYTRSSQVGAAMAANEESLSSAPPQQQPLDNNEQHNDNDLSAFMDEQRQQQQQQQQQIDNEHNDDLSAFMDEFEQNTAGEDFRRTDGING